MPPDPGYGRTVPATSQGNLSQPDSKGTSDAPRGYPAPQPGAAVGAAPVLWRQMWRGSHTGPTGCCEKTIDRMGGPVRSMVPRAGAAGRETSYLFLPQDFAGNVAKRAVTSAKAARLSGFAMKEESYRHATIAQPAEPSRMPQSRTCFGVIRQLGS